MRYVALPRLTSLPSPPSPLPFPHLGCLLLVGLSFDLRRWKEQCTKRHNPHLLLLVQTDFYCVFRSLHPAGFVIIAQPRRQEIASMSQLACTTQFRTCTQACCTKEVVLVLYLQQHALKMHCLANYAHSSLVIASIASSTPTPVLLIRPWSFLASLFLALSLSFFFILFLFFAVRLFLPCQSITQQQPKTSLLGPSFHFCAPALSFLAR